MNETDNQQERLTYGDARELAAWFGGEGCFGLFSHSSNRIYPAATLINSDFEIIEHLHTILERNKIGHNIQFRKSTNLNHKDHKTIFVVGMKRVKTLLGLILPHLVGRKKSVALEVLSYIEYRLGLPQNRKISSTDFAYRARVMALNKKGPSESPETIRQTRLA